MQQKNASDKQLWKFNVQNNNLHKQVAVHHIGFIKSFHHSGSKTSKIWELNNLQKQVAVHHIVFIKFFHHSGSNTFKIWELLILVETRIVLMVDRVAQNSQKTVFEGGATNNNKKQNKI